MDDTFLENAGKWFLEYVKGFYSTDKNLHHLLKLKENHSMRVAKDARNVAAELGWAKQDILLTEAAGLLHDVARFSQLVKFNTFSDADSFNHGEEGYEIMKDNELISSLSDEEKDFLLTGIRYHNRQKIPKGLSKKSLNILKLIRDSDKLDIVSVVLKAIEEGNVEDYQEILRKIDLNGQPSPELVEEIIATRSGSYANVKSLADVRLIMSAWVYDLNFAPSVKRFLGRNLLDDLLSALPDTSSIREITITERRYAFGMIAKIK